MQRRAAAIDEAVIPGLLRTFYERVRDDDALGPVFNDAVQNWDEHLQRLGDFWSSVMLASGRYKGNPVAMHLLHADRITPAMFDRWLGLWAATTDEMLPRHVAAAMQAKAARIADTLRSAIPTRATQ
jgi:hemoglobin